MTPEERDDTMHHCGTPWEISSGPSRRLGPIAHSLRAVSLELPADFEFEYCPKCSVRNMTDELAARFREVEKQLMAKPPEPPRQPKKTYEDVTILINRIEFMDRTLRVGRMGDGFFVQVQYMEADIDTGKVELQRARKWYISAFSTDTEVVETCFKACRTSMDHVLKEHFLFKGRRIYSPHFNVNARIHMCDEKRFDGRIPIPKES